ncbi:hypothetical protein MHYP_G00178270 [Metynnis hypsauchen]
MVSAELWRSLRRSSDVCAARSAPRTATLVFSREGGPSSRQPHDSERVNASRVVRGVNWATHTRRRLTFSLLHSFALLHIRAAPCLRHTQPTSARVNMFTSTRCLGRSNTGRTIAAPHRCEAHTHVTSETGCCRRRPSVLDLLLNKGNQPIPSVRTRSVMVSGG